MKSLVDHLSQYAAYHRDPHNIATHFVGIPLIVIAVATLLSRPQWMGISPAVLVMLASASSAVALYRRGDAWAYLRPQLLYAALGDNGRALPNCFIVESIVAQLRYNGLSALIQHFDVTAEGN